METLILYILLITFLASLFRSTFGFGESMIAVPLYCLFLPMVEAVPVAILMSITIATMVIVQDRKEVHFSNAKWLVFFAILGFPIGLLILLYGNELYIKLGLGLMVVIYSLYSLFAKPVFSSQKPSRLWVVSCGFLSGVFGGAYGFNGPPLVLFGNRMGWEGKLFRATMQAYFLPVGIISIVGYWAKGLINQQVLTYFLFMLPAILPGVYLGRYLNSKITGQSFYTYAYCALIVIGLIFIMNTLGTS